MCSCLPTKKRLSLLPLIVCLLVHTPHAVSLATPTSVFDRYGNIRWEDEQARLDNFAIFLIQNPSYIGYIYVWAGSRACRGEAQARAVRARDYLVRYRKISENRVVWQDEGYNENVETILQPWPKDKTMPTFRSDSVKDVVFIDTCRRGLPVSRTRSKRGRT
jgi:hypothetical protein